MRTALIALFVACAVGSSLGLDCSAKLEKFRQCVADSHKQEQQANKAKFDGLKPKLDACYTSNGCSAPVQKEDRPKAANKDGANGKHGAGQECRKAFQQAKRSKLEECVKQAVPGFVFPPKDDQHDESHRGGHGGFNHKDDNKALENCANKQAVRECKRALMNSTRPTDAEKKAKFEANCRAKSQCLAALGSDCQQQREQFQKASCQCRQQLEQQDDQIRAGISACANAPDRKGTHPPRKAHEQKSCDRQDPCTLGYDAVSKQRQEHQKGGKGGKGGHH